MPLNLDFGEDAYIASFLGHDGFESRKMVADIGIEQVIATEDDVVVGERECPMEFQECTKRDVAGGALFIAV